MKKLLSMLLSAALVTPLFAVPANATAAVRWDFDDTTYVYTSSSDTNQAGKWQSNRQALATSQYLSVEDGALKYYLSSDTTESAHTQNCLVSPNNLNIDGSQYKYIKIRLKSTLSQVGDFRISFTTTTETEQTNFGDTNPRAKSLYSEIAANSDYTDYIIDMSDRAYWTGGTIKRIWIMVNPYTVTSAGYIYIDYIEVTDYVDSSAFGEKVYQFTSGTESWVANNTGSGITLTASGYGTLLHTAPANAGSPFLLSPGNLNIIGAFYRYVKVRARSTLPSTAIGVSFLLAGETNDEWGNFNPDTNPKSVLVRTSVAASDVYTEYVIDMGSNTYWTNGTIRRLRLLMMPNNGNHPGGTVTIDWIKLTSDPSVTVASCHDMTVYNPAIVDNGDGTFDAGFTTDSVDPSDYTYLKFKLGDTFKAAEIDDTALAGMSGDMTFGVRLRNIDDSCFGNIGMSFTTELPVE